MSEAALPLDAEEGRCDWCNALLPSAPRTIRSMGKIYYFCDHACLEAWHGNEQNIRRYRKAKGWDR